MQKVYKSHFYYVFIFILFFNPAGLSYALEERHHVCLCEKCVIWVILNDWIYCAGHPYMSYWGILYRELIYCSSNQLWDRPEHGQ